MTKIVAIPAFTDNYIWCVYDEDTKRAVVVDPGDAEPVLKALDKLDLTLDAILITHHHFDHTGGVDAILAKTSLDTPVYGPDNSNVKQITNTVRDGDKISVLTLSFSIIGVPGHTLDHIAYYGSNEMGRPLLFCGDTLFAGGCGRVFEGTHDMMHSSLSKLAVLPGETQVYCAHEYTLANLGFANAVEPQNDDLQLRVNRDKEKRSNGIPTVPSTIEAELLTNPFLRCEESHVIAAANRISESSCNNSVAVFSALRGWKDTF